MAGSMKIGAAWWKQDKNGQDYLSVAISSPVALVLQPDQRLALFANPNKDGDNHPDYELVVMASRDQSGGGEEFSPQQAPRQWADRAGNGGSTGNGSGGQRQPARIAAQAAPAPQQRRAGFRQPAPPPDWRQDEALPDPFAE